MPRVVKAFEVGGRMRRQGERAASDAQGHTDQMGLLGRVQAVDDAPTGMYRARQCEDVGEGMGDAYRPAVHLELWCHGFEGRIAVVLEHPIQ